MWKRLVAASVIAFILYLFLFPFLNWWFAESKTLSVSIIDKTVPQNDYREHLGLFWVLNHLQIQKENQKKYRKERDYYGYKPDAFKGDDHLEIPDKVDLIYVADTYGVYTKDQDTNLLGERSDLIYGGLSIVEWNQIMSKKSRDNKLIVEFNSMAQPTPVITRKVVEKNLGITWTGWIGRYFPNLADQEVPIWLKENWEKQYQEKWSFTGQGICFVDESDKVIVIEKKHFEKKVSFIWTKEGKKEYPKARNAEYSYWFDIIIPSEQMTVEAKYKIDLSRHAETILQDHGIPLTFPAIMHNRKENIYYFAGDFADVGKNYYTDWKLFDWYYILNGHLNDSDAFFWKAYVPMMKQILLEPNH